MPTQLNVVETCAKLSVNPPWGAPSGEESIRLLADMEGVYANA
jgi:hypothetical protein